VKRSASRKSGDPGLVLPPIGVLCNLHRQDFLSQTASHVKRNRAFSIARSIAMAINALSEKLRSFAEAASRLPALRGGRAVNPSTV
jgi:hypothetical protein